MMESNYILEWLEEMYPDRLPLKQVNDFELGVLIGQRQLIEQLKIKLKINKPIEETIK
jgi:glutathione S-transferase